MNKQLFSETLKITFDQIDSGDQFKAYRLRFISKIMRIFCPFIGNAEWSFQLLLAFIYPLIDNAAVVLVGED